jgi:hypothetical protein
VPNQGAVEKRQGQWPLARAEYKLFVDGVLPVYLPIVALDAHDGPRRIIRAILDHQREPRRSLRSPVGVGKRCQGLVGIEPQQVAGFGTPGQRVARGRKIVPPFDNNVFRFVARWGLRPGLGEADEHGQSKGAGRGGCPVRACRPARGENADQKRDHDCHSLPPR